MSGNRCVLDTGVIIDYFSDANSEAWHCLERLAAKETAFYVSEITVMELLSYPDITVREEEELKLFLDAVNIQPINREIRECVIALRRKTKRKLPDAIIAATAVCLQVPLVTGDNKLVSTVFSGLRVSSPGNVLKKGLPKDDEA